MRTFTCHKHVDRIKIYDLDKDERQHLYEYGGSLFQQYHSQSFTRGDEYRCRRDDDCQDFHRSVSFLRPRAYLLLQMAENQCV